MLDAYRCARLNIAFWDYLGDRLGLNSDISPQLTRSHTPSLLNPFSQRPTFYPSYKKFG